MTAGTLLLAEATKRQRAATRRRRAVRCPVRPLPSDARCDVMPASHRGYRPRSAAHAPRPILAASLSASAFGRGASCPQVDPHARKPPHPVAPHASSPALLLLAQAARPKTPASFPASPRIFASAGPQFCASHDSSQLAQSAPPVPRAFCLPFAARISGKLNFFSGLGVVSVSLTGGISLLEMDAIYIAIKEASIPGILGIATLLSLKTSQPLIHTFIFNDKVFDVCRINRALETNNCQAKFDQLLINASWILAGSFFLSSLLNYLLAIILLTAEPGTVSFNQQLGKMTALSFPVIALPAMTVMMGNIFYLFRGIKKLTGLDLESIVKQK